MKTTVLISVTSNHQSNLKEVAMKGRLFLMAICLVLASFGTSWGADYFRADQQNMGNIGGSYNLSFYKFDQSFTPSFSTMNEVQIALYTTEECGLRVSIREGSIDGPVIGSSEIKLAPLAPAPDWDMAEFIFSRTLHINPGSTYYIDLELLYGTAFIAVSWEGGGYSQGSLYINEYNTPTDNSDMVFQTGVKKRLVVGGKQN